jgi:hypothetical protein
MTERSFGFDNKHWWGVVTNVMDPDQEGRVQIRIHGLHDNEIDIPNSVLPWAKPLQDITSAAHNKIGKIPVGLIVGSTVFGHFLDGDQQYPLMIGTISKAGDPSNTETAGGSETLIAGTNSTPPGGRTSNNAVITRSTQNIQSDDATKVTYPNYTPPEQKDSDGKDITAAAIEKTKFATNPTVASLTTLGGSILSQLQSVDPKNINAVLPNAIAAFIKMKDLNAFSSSTGTLNVLGMTLGSALTSISNVLGTSTVINSLATALNGSILSSNASMALYVALTNLNQPMITSTTISNVINLSLPGLTNFLTPLLQNGNLTAAQFENIIALYLEEIQNNGSQATLGNGITPSNILSVLSSVLPTISGAINQTMNNHLPESVLNNSIITQALQKFSMNQAYLKAPENGKKALAILATSASASQLNNNIASVVSSISGVTTEAKNILSSIF